MKIHISLLNHAHVKISIFINAVQATIQFGSMPMKVAQIKKFAPGIFSLDPQIQCGNSTAKVHFRANPIQ